MAQHGRVWHGMIGHGMACCGTDGMLWYVMSWYGMVWHPVTFDLFSEFWCFTLGSAIRFHWSLEEQLMHVHSEGQEAHLRAKAAPKSFRVVSTSTNPQNYAQLDPVHRKAPHIYLFDSLLQLHRTDLEAMLGNLYSDFRYSDLFYSRGRRAPKEKRYK